MTAPVRRSYDLPADVDTVFAALSGQGWAQRRAEVLRDGSRVVRREQTPEGGVVLVVSRELPQGVPGFLERFLPRDGRAQQTDVWEPPGGDGTRRATWQAEVAGAPADVCGTLRLEPRAGGCTYTIEGGVKVRVPLIGGKAETFLAGMIERLTEKEADLLREMVAG